MLDGRGEVLASHEFRRPLPREHLAIVERDIRERGEEAEGRTIVPADPELAARSIALGVAATGPGAADGPRRPGSSA